MTPLLCPSRTFLHVTSREISSISSSDAKRYLNVRKKLISPSWFSNMLNLPRLPLMVRVARPQKPQKCLIFFHCKSGGQPAGLGPDGLDCFSMYISMHAPRQGGLVFVCDCSPKYSLVIGWLVPLCLPAMCVVPDGG